MSSTNNNEQHGHGDEDKGLDRKMFPEDQDKDKKEGVDGYEDETLDRKLPPSTIPKNKRNQTEGEDELKKRLKLDFANEEIKETKNDEALCLEAGTNDANNDEKEGVDILTLESYEDLRPPNYFWPNWKRHKQTLWFKAFTVCVHNGIITPPPEDCKGKKGRK